MMTSKYFNPLMCLQILKTQTHFFSEYVEVLGVKDIHDDEYK